MEKLFISHAFQDKEFVGKFNSLITDSTKIDPKTIVATSVNKLDYGTNLPSFIKNSIENAKVFLCLSTPYSIISQWVLYEIGFAEGKGRKIIPVLWGIKRDELPVKLDNAFYLDLEENTNRVKIKQLLEEIAKEMSSKTEPSVKMNKSIDSFLEFIKNNNPKLPIKNYTRKEVKKIWPLERKFKRAKEELIIWGWSTGSVNCMETRGAFEAMIEANSKMKIKILILDHAGYKEASKHLRYRRDRSA